MPETVAESLTDSHLSNNGKVRDAACDPLAWEREVRDVADHTSEGPRRIEVGSCSVEYEIAPLHDGRFAMRAEYETGHSGGCHGWIAFESREESIAALLEEAPRHFDAKLMNGCVTKADLESGPKLLAILNPDTLFGFEEPDPIPRLEWYPQLIAGKVDSMAMYQGWDILDIVRNGNYRPISKAKDGNFFAIPTPWEKKSRQNGDNSDDSDD